MVTNSNFPTLTFPSFCERFPTEPNFTTGRHPLSIRHFFPSLAMLSSCARAGSTIPSTSLLSLKPSFFPIPLGLPISQKLSGPSSPTPVFSNSLELPFCQKLSPDLDFWTPTSLLPLPWPRFRCPPHP